MNSLKKRSISLLFLLAVSMHLYSRDRCIDEYSIDIMADFGYPVLQMESIRSDVAQALYYVQNSDGTHGERAISMLQSANNELEKRHNMDQDDHDFFQAMIDKINSLIMSLEDETQRSTVESLCQQLQSKL